MTTQATTTRTEPRILLHGAFSPKLRIYMLAYWTMAVVLTIVGIPLLPFWLVIGPIWIRRYHAALRCDLTERNVIVGKGLVFRRELTIPLDKIQDISIREGPLLSAFGLLQLRIETAGQSNAATGQSDADLVGLIDARQVRDQILAQRDALTSFEKQPGAIDSSHELLTEIRDSLLRLEDAMKQGGGLR
ncbi:PH domain-containing protein [Sphingomonas sp. 37zxx]|uniref:PH domain-containing protein n=1 Tax=Sphingomonas sp. 37zxx TaxID=1550073 RepID=UPI00053C00C5|nr:PH domain-containing protein [Sphingomonas sp. 37zxx]